MDNILQPLVRAWTSKLQKAYAHKEREFQRDADECMQFFNGPHDFMYDSLYSMDVEMPQPSFRMTLNKVAEVVQLYGPSMYHRNPFRTVSPRTFPDFPTYLLGDPNDPTAQQSMQQLTMVDSNRQGKLKAVSDLMQHMLNYTPNELDLRSHSRQMVDEAIIKGMGVLWTEVYQSPSSRTRMIGSFYDTVDNLLIDPDAESIEEAKYVARRRIQPTWEVEERFSLPKGSLRGNMQSLGVQAEIEGNPEYKYFQARGDTNDLFLYFDVYSLMGVGHLLKDCHYDAENRALLDQFGKRIYMAVSEESSWPLNLPQEVFENAPLDEVFMRLQWPIPFWADPTNPWPFSYCAYHKVPGKLWPMSHIKPGLGELKFLNWALSFLADKIKNTSRDFVAVLKSASEELKSTILNGRDLSLLEFENINGSIRDVVQMLQFEPVNPDIWRIIDAMLGILDKRLGTNELMYGQSARQMRSAQEAAVKVDQVSIRPDDMAEQTEATMTMVARKEAIALRWILTGEDVQPYMGPERARLWDALVRTEDLDAIVTELEYRIEAGSVRKPNRNRDIENANNSVQVWGPFFQNYSMQTGDFEAINTLLENWAKANDIEPSKMRLNPPPPPDPNQAAMAEQQSQQAQMEAELQMKQQEHQLNLQQSQEKHQLSVQQLMEKAQLQAATALQKAGQDLQQDQVSHMQELSQDQQGHRQELQQDRENHLLNMLQTRQMGEVQQENAASTDKYKGAK
jgi:hypothetical protein